MKKLSKALALVLSLSLVFQLSVPAFASEKAASEPVTTFSTDLPDNLYAGVKYNIRAITAGGDTGSIDYSWKVEVKKDGVFEQLTGSLQEGTTGVNDDGFPYQNASLYFEENMAGSVVRITASYGNSSAEKEFTLKKPISSVELLGKTNDNRFSYYDKDTNTLYADTSYTFSKSYTDIDGTFTKTYEMCEAEIGAQYDASAQDSLTAVVSPEVKAGIRQNNGKAYVSAVMGAKADMTGSLRLEPSSGYKVSKKINLVKGVPATKMQFTANGGFFANGLNVATLTMIKNPEFTKKAVLYETVENEKVPVTTVEEIESAMEKSDLYVLDNEKSSFSGFMMMAGESISIDAKINAPSNANDTFSYALYHDNGAFIKELSADEDGSCKVQINDPGSYYISFKAVSVGGGHLERNAKGTISVLVKEANPITSIETSKDKITLSNKEFTKDGVTYKTAANFADYISATPADYLDKMEYSSDNTALVTVDESGNIEVPTNAKGGTTKIWAKSAVTGVAKAIEVEVIPGTVSMKIEVPEYAKLPGGHSEKLELTVNPANSNEKVEWISSNPNVLSVDNNGNIKANAAYSGEPVNVKVTATSSSGVTAQREIIVVEAVPTVNSSISAAGLDDAKVYQKGNYEYDVYYGDKVKVIFDITGKNNVKSNDIIKWGVSDTDMTVEDYFQVHETGENYIVLSAKSDKPVKLRAYALKSGQLLSQASAMKELTINPVIPAKSLTLTPKSNPFIYLGNTHEFTVKVNSSVSSLVSTDSLVFDVRNDDIASVTKQDGKYVIKALKPGITEITCYACYDAKDPEGTCNAKATLTVTVEEKISMKSDAISVTGLKDYVYNGKENKPSIKVLYGNVKLTENKDYEITYSNTVSAGTAKVTIKGIGNYKDSLTFTYSIDKKDISSGYYVTLSQSSYSYSGKENKPVVTIRGLEEGKDFTVSYKNTVSAGTAKVTIKGTGNYNGTLEKSYTIKPASISKMDIKLGYTKTVYNGKEKKPAVTISGLKKGTDYTVEYKNNVKVGTARITVTGKGNYSGSAYAIFSITNKSISKLKISLVKTNFSYSGTSEAKLPDVVVKDGTKTLARGTDYNLTYKSNYRPGKATVEISGKGNYSGTVKKTFRIRLKTPSVKISTVAKTGKPKLTWYKVPGANKYVIYRATSKNGTYKKYFTTTKLSFINTSAKVGKKYYYKVKAVYTDNQDGNSYYSKVKSITCDCSRPDVKISLKNKKPNLKWGKVDGANRYTVYRATSKNGKYQQLKTVYGTSYRDKNAKKGITYYYKVKALNKTTSNADSYFSKLDIIESK